MKYSHRTWIVISGLIWLAVGVLLLTKGLVYTVGSVTTLNEPSAVLSFVLNFTGTVEQAALFLISLGLLVGFVKGRYVLVKTVRRVVHRILAQGSPIHWKDVYSRGYYTILFSMMLLGMLFKWLPIGLVVKGFIDVAIGSALINGALLYFREAMAYRRKAE